MNVEQSSFSGVVLNVSRLVGWDAEAAAARFRGFRGRGQASGVPWLYGAVLYGWAENTN